ncbi:MAG: hypothetical protein ACYS47_19100, partial [Planctomycetota bacterium]
GLTQTHYDHTPPNNREVRYRVRSTVPVGSYTLYSLWSLVSLTCVVDIQSPGAPASITVPSSSSNGTYTVSWGTALNASGYELEEDTLPSFPSPSTVYQGSGTSTQITGRLQGTYYYRVRGVNGLLQGPYTAGANPCTVTLIGTLLLSAGTSPFPTTVQPGASNLPVLQIVLTADNVENITVRSIRVTETGTLNPASGVTAATLYEDVDADGAAGAGDRLIASVATSFQGGFVFTGLAETIPSSGNRTWLVTYDLAAGAPLGATVRVSLAQNADVWVTGSLTPAPLVSGAPVVSPSITIAQLGSLALSAGPSNPGPFEVQPGAAGYTVLHVRLVAGQAEPVSLRFLSITGAGSGDETTGIEGATLHLDADGDNLFDPEIDTLWQGPLRFFSDDGKVTFSVNRTVPPGGTESLFVLYDFSTNVSEGSTFRAGVAVNAEVIAEGVFSQNPVPVTGAPVWGGEFTIRPSSPPPAREKGGCGGGTSASGGEAFLCWALLLAVFVLVRRVAVRRG